MRKTKVATIKVVRSQSLHLFGKKKKKKKQNEKTRKHKAKRKKTTQCLTIEQKVNVNGVVDIQKLVVSVKRS